MANLVSVLRANQLHHIAGEAGEFGIASPLRSGPNHVRGESEESLLQGHQGDGDTRAGRRERHRNESNARYSR